MSEAKTNSKTNSKAMTPTTQKPKFIGRGAFTKCYRLTKNTVLLFTEDPTKLAMSEQFWPKSPRFPKIRKCDEYENAYISEYMPPIRSLKSELDPSEYKLYKELVNAQRRARHDVYGVMNLIHHPIKYDILEAADVLANYGTDYPSLDIAKKNVRAKKGKLILLDIFYFTRLRQWGHIDTFKQI